LQAGKHVYCEAPLGGTVEDARAIAQAAKAAVKVNFQAGLQNRSDPQRLYIRSFIRSGALGKNVMTRSQWHKKQSWRRTAPSTEREQALNWRLQKATSSGLVGEIGIHQLDIMNWFLGELPKSATGFGGILNWNDGRDVADTVQSVIQYAGDVNYSFDATLANNFDSDYEMMYGTYAAVMMRGNKAWMFKESDSPQLGWEVYARKDLFYQETGIALSLDATKLVALQNKPTAEASYEDSSLHFALKSFITNSHITGTGVENFISNYGADADGLGEYLATLSKGRQPAAGYQEGFEATVTAIKTNEAIMKGGKIAMEKEWFQL
jgi:predicted dehydrogenase